MKNNIFKIIISVLIVEMAGLIGSIFTAPAIQSWYKFLVKPNLSPPNWVFAPVWTILFALMGVAIFLVWNKRKENSKAKLAIAMFIIQLVLNILWSAIFFGLRAPGAAFIEIMILWLAILATIISFDKVDRPAAWLLMPYIVWVSFAAYLNYSIWRLN